MTLRDHRIKAAARTYQLAAHELPKSRKHWGKSRAKRLHGRLRAQLQARLTTSDGSETLRDDKE